MHLPHIPGTITAAAVPRGAVSKIPVHRADMPPHGHARRLDSLLTALRSSVGEAIAPTELSDPRTEPCCSATTVAS
eukprot:COSAG06_NODE_7174_length_2597_cov_31.316653_4_plen_76_part_00